MRDEAIGVGLIGYGLGGSAFHAPLIQAEPGLRLRAVVTSRAGQVGRELPGVRVVGSAEELLEDPAVRVLMLYVEAADDGVAFAALARRARVMGKHLVVLRSGRSSAGRRAVASVPTPMLTSPAASPSGNTHP